MSKEITNRMMEIACELITEQAKNKTLHQENARKTEALKEISENNYDRYGLYDDDLQEQIDRLQQIATEALQQNNNSELLESE